MTSKKLYWKKPRRSKTYCRQKGSRIDGVNILCSDVAGVVAGLMLAFCSTLRFKFTVFDGSERKSLPKKALSPIIEQIFIK